MQKRYFRVTAITVVLGILAVAGYLIPEKIESMPARVMLENSGGRVIFSHKVHAEDYGFSCEECHHGNDPGNISSCSQCHPPGLSGSEKVLTRAEALHQQCMGCHEESDSGPFGVKSCNQCHPGR